MLCFLPDFMICLLFISSSFLIYNFVLYNTTEYNQKRLIPVKDSKKKMKN